MRLPLFAAALLTGSLFAADPELLNLLPPDTMAAAGINVGQAALSPFGQYLLLQSQQSADAGLQKLVESTGFDPRRDLREILVAMNTQPGAHSGIIVARGVFDIPRIIEASLASGATAETYKGVQTVQGPSNGHDTLAFPDSTMAIVGDPVNVRAAIDRKLSSAPANPALVSAVSRASAGEDAWFTIIVPLSQLQAAPSAPGAQDPFAMLNKVQQASGGIKFGANVVVTVKAICQSAPDAAALSETLKSFAGIAMMAAP